MKRADGLPFIIAEIGGNHEGDQELAKDLLLQAADGGADAVKFQIYTGDGIVNRAVDPDRAEHFDRFSLSVDNYLELAVLAKENGIDFNASVWNIEMLELFSEHLSFYKVGSGDLTAFQFLEQIAAFELPIVVSSGLADFGEVNAAIRFLREKNSVYQEAGMLALLQCTSMYPISSTDANLNVITEYKRQFPELIIGYSDHTEGVLANLVAMSMGAEILEVHFTDARIRSDFRDHRVSLNRDQLKELRAQSIEIKNLKGSGVKELLEIEKANGHDLSFRRALYLNKDMAAGSVVGRNDVVSLRPLKGLSADQYEVLLGKKVKNSIRKLKPLDWQDFE